MDAAGIDLLFVEDPSNMAWLTGYDGWSFYVHQGVLLGMEGDPVWWGRRQDANGARRTVWMGEDEHPFLPPTNSCRTPRSTRWRTLARLIGELGHGRRGSVSNSTTTISPPRPISALRALPGGVPSSTPRRW
jgi:ectoine hydrolase